MNTQPLQQVGVVHIGEQIELVDRADHGCTYDDGNTMAAAGPTGNAKPRPCMQAP
jgi:hypothetical protein